MVADDTASSSVTSNIIATNGTSWIDATPVLITGLKLNCQNADLASEKMIGKAKEYNGLYILGSTHIPTFNKIVLSANCPSNILLWHYRCEPIQQSQNTRDNLEHIQQSQNTQDKVFFIVYTKRQETQEKESPRALVRDWIFLLH
ncbi:uncharacterized protein G2W53_001439 [Senna tora]|uniref:Uncharacterized protein n=1 Tax=Senna tora TaxID=362788 RepID=A0A834XHM8_9FABA|nr:uncharacterized protein G2W53_001439 [Senna tora]